jgi:hypothetical protein
MLNLIDNSFNLCRQATIEEHSSTGTLFQEKEG